MMHKIMISPHFDLWRSDDFSEFTDSSIVFLKPLHSVKMTELSPVFDMINFILSTRVSS